MKPGASRVRVRLREQAGHVGQERFERCPQRMLDCELGPGRPAVTVPIVALRRSRERQLLSLEKGLGWPYEPTAEHQVELASNLREGSGDVRSLTPDVGHLRIDVDAALGEQELEHVAMLGGALSNVLSERQHFERALDEGALHADQRRGERFDLDIPEGIRRLGNALAEHQHAQAFADEEGSTQQRLQLTAEDDHVVEASGHGTRGRVPPASASRRRSVYRAATDRVGSRPPR